MDVQNFSYDFDKINNLEYRIFQKLKLGSLWKVLFRNKNSLRC